MKGVNVLLVCIIVLLIGVSGFAKYYKYVIQRDYLITAAVSCNPESESCFVYECDGPECTEQAYKYIEKKAYDFAVCNPYTQECQEETCTDESGCTETLCTESSLGEGERCISSVSAI